jgi:hypothetical protein
MTQSLAQKDTWLNIGEAARFLLGDKPLEP